MSIINGASCPLPFLARRRFPCVESWPFEVRATWRRVAWPGPGNELAQTDERRFAVAAWRGAPDFTDAERAALALTESITQLSGRTNPILNEIWDEAARHYDEPALATLAITPATAKIVLDNRAGGPERVIDLVEERAPDGFAYLDQVASQAELEAIVKGYCKLAGFDQIQVNRSKEVGMLEASRSRAS